MKAHQRSCNELGLCQHRNPACNGCTWRTDRKVYAPGTIEGPFITRRYRSHFTQAMRLFMRHLAFFGPTVFVIALFVGLIARKLGYL